MIALQLGAGGRHHVRRANPYLCMCCIVQGYACAPTLTAAADGPSRSLLCTVGCSGCNIHDSWGGCALTPTMLHVAAPPG